MALWGAAEVGTQTTGRFWVAMAIVAGAGLLLALANHVGTWTKGLRMRISPSTFVLAFLPVLVCVGWILVATQPGTGWQEGRLDSWSNSIGILGLVKTIALWHGVLAFGLGLVLGLSFDGVPAPVEEPGPAYAGAAAPATDEPVAAERRRTRRRRPVADAPPAGGPGRPTDAPAATPTDETTRTHSRVPGP
ncbi:MAG TPA: hypothetical protein VE984_06235 [Gaiellaceae bacterium]|nr:hypothetical protein [Gaiellaceae bacterium]